MTPKQVPPLWKKKRFKKTGGQELEAERRAPLD